MASRRRKSMIRLFRNADREFGNESPNYNNEFGKYKSPENLSWNINSPTIYNNEYNDFCKKRALNSLIKTPGKVFTRKRTNLKNKMNECINDSTLHEIFNAVHEISIFKKTNNLSSLYKKRHSNINNKISKTIRVNGIHKIIDYLLLKYDILQSAKTMDYDKLKRHIKYIILKEIKMNDTFKIKIKFNPRRSIREIPRRSQILENSKNPPNAS